MGYFKEIKSFFLGKRILVLRILDLEGIDFELLKILSGNCHDNV